MPTYSKTAFELVHNEVRNAIINGSLDTIEQRNSYELSSTLSLKYKNSFSSNTVLKVHRFRCRKFFKEYYKPLLVDNRFYFKVFDIDGEKNVGVFASRIIHCNDYLCIETMKGYRGQHISELKSVVSHSVFAAQLQKKIVKDSFFNPNMRRLEQYFILLGSISFLNVCLHVFYL
jgi:hypothetical protein